MAQSDERTLAFTSRLNYSRLQSQCSPGTAKLISHPTFEAEKISNFILWPFLRHDRQQFLQKSSGQRKLKLSWPIKNEAIEPRSKPELAKAIAFDPGWQNFCFYFERSTFSFIYCMGSWATRSTILLK
ncbi:unnamed protein product [Clavelina lepadiformis]|uniref:Uncharacterized protein n=1 Tax=Clavelina lepadiformis TaxID=159417 RepID=A0ABP0GLS7_CLALP